MTLGTIRLFDYRCFQRESPGVLTIESGVTSIIGNNNSGKSTLIKSIYEARSIFKTISNTNKYKTGLPARIVWEFPPQINETDDLISDREDPVCAIEIEPSSFEESFVSKARIEIFSQKKTVKVSYFSCNGEQLAEANEIVDSNHVEMLARKNNTSQKAMQEFASALANCQYFGAFRNIVNEGAGEHYDCHIGTGFVTQWHEWKTGQKKSHNRAIERVTEDIRRLIGAKRLEINAASGFKTLQVTIDNRPHKLQDLGSGFSQLFSTLGSALIKQPSFVLIDEPETHLHPSLQSEFLNALASHAKFGIIFTTHSIGLARLADNCYTVKREENRSVVRKYERTHNLSEFLGSLGIAGLMELGWDRILLVEGTKDVRTAQQILRIYGKEKGIIVIPLGGDGMVNGKVAHELSGIRKLCQNVFAIIDSERKSSAEDPMEARQKFFALCKNLGIRCCVTEKRAIENYITQRSVDLAWPNCSFRALSDYEKNKDPPWGKGESWRAAKHMTRAELDSTDIGKFFASI